MTEAMKDRYIESLERENAILRGRQKAVCAVLGQISNGLEYDTETALASAVALLRAAIREMEGEQNG